MLQGHRGITCRRIPSPRCPPPQNRAPRDDELSICREQWLDRQIGLVRPQLVVLLGTAAIRQRFGGRPELVKLRGHVRTHEGQTFLLTYHPASVMRFPNARNPMNDDLVHLKPLVAGARGPLPAIRSSCAQK